MISHQYKDIIGLPHPVSRRHPPMARQEQQERERAALARERSGQQAVIALRKKYGKNAVLRGMDLLEGATSVARNGQIGGHKA